MRLSPEPNNAYDSHAVAFECEVAGPGCWKVFGYVPKELCDFVLSAIDKGEILNVEFSWIKYKIVRSTGPGYYTAVKVTKRNEWPQLQCDTMYH